jgi:dipeptide transport system ATP-binding protein
MTALVEARGLERIYEVGGGFFRKPLALRAVGGVSFDIARARTLAVVGESGCGKSTLARMVTMIEPPTAGTLRIDGLDATEPGREHELRRKVQIVFQNPYGSLNPRKTIQSILEEPLIINTGLDARTRRNRVRDMLEKVGLRPEYARRYPHMFSGGQRQRIAIARALMLDPLLLVADEPVSALDVSVQAQILNLLTDLQRDLQIACLFISHDLGVVRHIAHDVLVMYLGIAVETGPKERIFARALHPYTQALLASTPGFGRRREKMAKGELPSPLRPPAGCVFSTRCPYVTDKCRAERPPLRPVDGRDVACHYAEQFVGGSDSFAQAPAPQYSA